MHGKDPVPGRDSHLLDQDDDGPPPRKKVLSRFFPRGTSLVGKISGMSKRSEDKSESATPLIENQAYITQPRSQPSTPNTCRSKAYPGADTHFPNREKTSSLDKSSIASETTTLDNRTSRDQKRRGIVGLSSLLPPESGRSATAQALNQEPNSISTYISQTDGNLAVNSLQPTTTQAQSQGTGWVRRVSQQPRALLGKLQSSTSMSNQSQEATVSSTEDKGPLNAPPPEINTSRNTVNNAGLQLPFLPRPAVIASGVDLDRDATGKKLPPLPLPPIHNLPDQGITSLPHHATLTPSRRNQDFPLNYYTSPGRIQSALEFSRKRKRTSTIIPPPAFTYQRTNDPNFNVFNGILLYPELVFRLASILPLADLISLYAISRDFHTIVDTRFTTVVLSQVKRKAPESAQTFRYRSYGHLCRKDPAARLPHPNPEAAAAGQVRMIPSLRWLAMVLHREKVVHELVTLFAEDGVPLPARCALAIKRMWFILDIPDNARRIGFIHNVNLFTDLDLYFAMCFFIKLDMRLNDPMASHKRDGMRKMLLSQRSFTTILKVLRRDMWQKQGDVMRAWIRYKYQPLPDEAGMNIFGVPAAEVGKGKMEYWGKAPAGVERRLAFLLRPDQLIMREAIKRGLRFHKHFLRCVTYGYVRMDTLENYAPRKINRRQENIKDEYGVDDDIGGLTWSMETAGLEDGKEGDMLDLGERKSVSLLCIEGGSQSLITPEDRLKMKEEEQFLEACMRWSEAEREEGDVDVNMLLN